MKPLYPLHCPLVQVIRSNERSTMAALNWFSIPISPFNHPMKSEADSAGPHMLKMREAMEIPDSNVHSCSMGYGALALGSRLPTSLSLTLRLRVLELPWPSICKVKQNASKNFSISA
jgi:hypothetical protein